MVAGSIRTARIAAGNAMTGAIGLHVYTRKTGGNASRGSLVQKAPKLQAITLRKAALNLSISSRVPTVTRT
jgi:hypothetical protein